MKVDLSECKEIVGYTEFRGNMIMPADATPEELELITATMGDDRIRVDENGDTVVWSCSLGEMKLIRRLFDQDRVSPLIGGALTAHEFEKPDIRKFIQNLIKNFGCAFVRRSEVIMQPGTDRSSQIVARASVEQGGMLMAAMIEHTQENESALVEEILSKMGMNLGGTPEAPDQDAPEVG